MDDVILFCFGSLEEWRAFKDILDIFCEASSMSININKSSFLHNDLDEDILQNLAGHFPYRLDSLSKHFVYLGCYLKSSGYLVKDWF